MNFSDRSADMMKRAMATWTALFSMLFFILAWILMRNVFQVPLDNPQLTILNLVLSSLAGLQCFILLIAAKRGETQNERLVSKIALETDEIDTLIRENTELTKAIHALVSKA